jgi:hypothetical protein
MNSAHEDDDIVDRIQIGINLVIIVLCHIAIHVEKWL